MKNVYLWEYTWVMTKKGKRVRSKMSWLSSSRLHQSSKSSLLWWKSFSCSYHNTGLKSRSLQKLFKGRPNCRGQLKLTEHPPLRWGGQEQLGWQCSLVRAPDCAKNLQISIIRQLMGFLLDLWKYTMHHNASQCHTLQWCPDAYWILCGRRYWATSRKYEVLFHAACPCPSDLEILHVVWKPLQASPPQDFKQLKSLSFI